MSIFVKLKNLYQKKPLILMIVGMAIVYFPLLFFGYGSDNDTFRILQAGDNIFQTFNYIPSRIPGCLLYELFVHVIRQMGGAFLSNLFTLLIACIGVYSFYSICRFYKVPHTELLTLVFMTHPVWIANSTLTHDFVWALSFSLLGYLFFIRSQFTISSIIWGLGNGIRVAVFIFPLVALLINLVGERKQWVKVIISALIILIITVLLYLPSMNFYQFSTKFFTYQFNQFPSRGVLFQTGVFVYRNIYFWGLPIILFLLLALYLVIKNRVNIFQTDHHTKKLIYFCLITFILNELFYWKLPFQLDYLLPILPVCLILFSFVLNKTPKMLWFLFFICLALGFFNINIAKPDQPNHATKVQWGLWVEPGYLIVNIRDRYSLRNCETLECYQAISENKVESFY